MSALVHRFGYNFQMRHSLWAAVVVLALSSCAHYKPIHPKDAFDLPVTARGCEPLSGDDRLALLQIADPQNYPSTRYRRGPSSARSIEQETDCSHFVHEIYQRAGLSYNFRPTDAMAEATEFEKVPDEEARPGDILLLRGHMGILDEEGKLISATRTRHRKTKTSITRYDLKNFRRLRGRRYVLRYRCRPTDATLVSQSKKESTR